MKYLLDANVWIELLRQRNNDLVLQRFKLHVASEIATSAVVQAELLVGAFKSRSPSVARTRISELLDPHVLLSFEAETAVHYAQVRAALEKRGLIIGHNDLMIAATALQHGLTLVTHNTREFGRVSGLRIEDWQERPQSPAPDPLA